MTNFWNKLKPPFTVLAPMEGVTDIVFRQIITSIGKPDVFFTEFTSTDGLMSKGKKEVEKNLGFLPKQKPIIAQIWGNKPENFYKACEYIKSLGFSGIDINMGCPDKTVVKHGCGGALIDNKTLAKEIIQAAKEGSGNLPISIKTRIGVKSEQIDEWISFLLNQNLSAITVHLRTVKELSKVPAHWEFMSKIITLRNSISPNTVIIGNGDIKTLSEVKEKYKLYKCEGFMIGTGVMANPWVFNKKCREENILASDRISLYLEHAKLFEKIWENKKNPAILKKFCKVYVNNFADAGSLREKIMRTNTLEEIKSVLQEKLKQQT